MPLKPRTKRRSLTPQQRAFATPAATYKSGLEDKVAEQIEAAGHQVRYEKLKLPWVQPQSEHSYRPDFLLDNGIVVETKGLWETADRKKMLLVKAQHPNLDIRMVFSNAMAKIAKASKTTYAKFCDDHGIKWAHRAIPREWFLEGAA